MSLAVVTGSGGLVGSCVTQRLVDEGMDVIGIDCNMRETFFGQSASVDGTISHLKKLPSYRHSYGDIRNRVAVRSIYGEYGRDIVLTVHAASQPSHDFSASNVLMDFDINASATLTLLEEHRRFCPDAAFVYISTNKVYGNRVNRLKFIDLGDRFDLAPDHPMHDGIDESFSIDQTMHSPFGVSKLSGDLATQEFGRYFGMKTVCFRCGCITGVQHQGVPLHGFLSHLSKQICDRLPYVIIGYGGKQVRDNINAVDLANAIWMFFRDPDHGEVYNMGGGRESNCSVLEAIKYCQELVDRPVGYTFSMETRLGDHKWWISDTTKFKDHYPDWCITIDWRQSLQEMVERWRST